jgi:hypothetical protein
LTFFVGYNNQHIHTYIHTYIHTCILTYIHAATVPEVHLVVLQEMKEDLSKAYAFTAFRSSKNNEFATESIV